MAISGINSTSIVASAIALKIRIAILSCVFIARKAEEPSRLTAYKIASGGNVVCRSLVAVDRLSLYIDVDISAHGCTTIGSKTSYAKIVGSSTIGVGDAAQDVLLIVGNSGGKSCATAPTLSSAAINAMATISVSAAVSVFKSAPPRG
jgi:hypothetical protein